MIHKHETNLKVWTTMDLSRSWTTPIMPWMLSDSSVGVHQTQGDSCMTYLRMLESLQFQRTFIVVDNWRWFRWCTVWLDITILALSIYWGRTTPRTTYCVGSPTHKFIFSWSVWPWPIFDRGGWSLLFGDGRNSRVWFGVIALDLAVFLWVSRTSFRDLGRF